MPKRLTLIVLGLWLSIVGTAQAQTYTGAIHAPIPAPVQTAETSSYQVLSTDNGTDFSNAGATSSVAFTLPSSPVAGQYNCFFGVVVGQQITLVTPSASVTI